MNNGELVTMLAPVLTPHGVLTLRPSGDVAPLESALGPRLEKAFAKGPGHGLLYLGADEVGTVLPPELSYWREFGVRYVTALCALHGIGESRAKPPMPAPSNSELEQLAFAVPPMAGAEYLTTPPVGRPMASHRCGLRCRIGRGQTHRAGVPQRPPSRLEPGWPRALQSRREPQGRRRAVCIPGYLHDATFRLRRRRSMPRISRPESTKSHLSRLRVHQLKVAQFAEVARTFLAARHYLAIRNGSDDLVGHVHAHG
jgi:hypothetical protein